MLLEEGRPHWGKWNSPSTTTRSQRPGKQREIVLEKTAPFWGGGGKNQNPEQEGQALSSQTPPQRAWTQVHLVSNGPSSRASACPRGIQAQRSCPS